MMSKLISMILTLAALFVLGFWAVQTKANFLKLTDSEETAQIKQTIEAYFEARYSAHKSLELEGVEDLIDDSFQANEFRRSEIEKLEIELYHDKLNHLRYIYYDIFLEFEEISLYEVPQTAIVSITEGHDVIFEDSAPAISSMRNLQHTINLRKVNGAWIIVSDDYNDYVWRMIRATKRPKEEIFRSIDEAFRLDTSLEDDQSDETTCSLPFDETSYAYSRYGAIEYAHNWAFDRNPDYYDFSNLGGDCTNFVSQAIYEGGTAPMVFGGAHGIGTDGWYYYSLDDRAAAWNLVDRLYNLIVGEIFVWPLGPEGCEKDFPMVEVGDLIQYDWDGNEIWDHSVMIVSKQWGGQLYDFDVAGHSPDVDNYPYDAFNYNDIRYIHIERIDGVAVFLSLILNNLESMENQMESPYPEPTNNDVDSGMPLPYPYP